jgi:hypothetical protein
MFVSMNKNLVLISSIGLFLADVHNPLRSLFFLVSHIVCMRPCETLGMEEWLLRPSYYFATYVGEAKSTCLVLEFDSHFQNSDTVEFCSNIAEFCSATVELCSSGIANNVFLCAHPVLGKNLRSSGTVGETMCSSGTWKKLTFIWY